MHKSSYLKMEYFKDTYLKGEEPIKILDIGSFDKNNYNYSMIMNEREWVYQGLDIKEGPNVDIVVSNPYNWVEIEDSTYDVIISGQTFEHIEFFWLTMEQIKRVLKPGGLCCIIASSSGPDHKHPYDCYRFTKTGMENLAKCVNFKIIESGTNFDELSDPWNESYLIAKKPLIEKSDLYNRIDNIKEKINIIIDELNN